MYKVPAAFVERISKAAFLVDDSKLQLETLMSILGIGPATATDVFAFHDPTNYVVGDRIRIDIPNETDPDFELHGEHGLVIAVDPDHGSCSCGVLYEITLENYEFTIEMHSHDLRLKPILLRLEIEEESQFPVG